MNESRPPDPRSLHSAYQRLQRRLFDQCEQNGHWIGRLSTSALSTATAIVAIELMRRAGTDLASPDVLRERVRQGREWLLKHQNDDGGWGDTVRSFSNISTSMLVHAALKLAPGDQPDRVAAVLTDVEAYIQAQGGVPGLYARYGQDKTFSIPILTQCALAGTVEWSAVSGLPFELAWVPQRFYRAVRMPVVSYALPALIAIGQVRHHFRPTRWRPLRWLRNLAIRPTLKVLQTIQPSSGGFLEAAPLTSFVTMSLAGMGQHEHPVAQAGLKFLLENVREDGSWPIDTNLATWVTTLAINAVDRDLPEEFAEPLAEWLLGQQYRERHAYTGAEPGGWAWTDLPGGVPDADDTPGAMLALMRLSRRLPEHRERIEQAVRAATQWLCGLQNRDGGWPTFCRGWGRLPFDRSSADITAHCLRALQACLESFPPGEPHEVRQIELSVERGMAFLWRGQRADGSWLPLWFGNQHAVDDENPTYGTARVLAACAELAPDDERTAAGYGFLRSTQNSDGGWSGAGQGPSSVEETALAVDMLSRDPHSRAEWSRGLEWLVSRIERSEDLPAAPIGFYFAKLWYFEDLYPLIFSVSALRQALETLGEQPAEAAPAWPTPRVELAPSASSPERH